LVKAMFNDLNPKTLNTKIHESSESAFVYPRDYFGGFWCILGEHWTLILESHPMHSIIKVIEHVNGHIIRPKSMINIHLCYYVSMSSTHWYVN
jgi:hypothetical protein